ncbi:Fen2 protein [Saccharomycopsis crataegensis]|uniref:Fen2 protein n=1 Tax=Saccharomycopsis crataegensis TaxID=43959 RepID=A0AAV5QR46_9ASCO|nr:Fen2 protein [Saccharomycopsis crataegensis]
MILKPFYAVRDALWGKPPSDPKEAKLLFKIDVLVLSFTCLCYWSNYLDRTNFANAYVSGMAEAVGMKGDDYNIVNTCFTVGYTIGMLPNNIALLKLKPRYWMCFCMIAWGLLVLGMYKVTSYRQLCVIRFFQAIFESSTFSGTHLILGNWYKETELTKRSAVFTSSGLIGSIFSGFMQSAIHTNLDGRNGLAGWQWLFIIDFIITMPIVVYGFFFFPDYPSNCSVFFLSEEEKQLAIDRLPPRAETKFDLSVVKRVVGRWHWWLFSILWMFAGENESFGINSLFALWLKWAGYSISDRNNYPMGIYAVGIVATFASSLYVDLTGARYHWHIALLIFVFMIISVILTLAAPLNTAAVFVAQYFSGVSFAGQAVYFAWANVVCHNDLEEAAITLASMNMFSNAVNAWWSILFFKATYVPKWKHSCYAMIATLCVSVIVAAAIRFLQLKEEKMAEKVVDDESVEQVAVAVEEKRHLE